MNATRRLLVHVGILVVAAAGAGYVWTRDKNPKSTVVADVTVWSGKAADVEKVSFDAKSRKIRLEAKKDGAGRWYEGSVDKQAPAPVGDAGAPEAKPASVLVISVKAAQRIAEALAPLKAVRELGKIGAERAEEFGLKEPEGTLTVVVAGQEHTLVVGANAPGGTDRYVKDPATQIVYAVQGEFLRDLLAGETVLNERELHGFEEDEIEKVRITSGGKSREILRAGVGGRGWADPGTPDKQDETVGTWMSKVDRLRPSEYVAVLPGAPEGALLVRVEYVGKKGPIGFLEVLKFAAPTADDSRKTEWFLRTERTRRYAKVFASSGEQLEQDVNSVVR